MSAEYSYRTAFLQAAPMSLFESLRFGRSLAPLVQHIAQSCEVVQQHIQLAIPDYS